MEGQAGILEQSADQECAATAVKSIPTKFADDQSVVTFGDAGGRTGPSDTSAQRLLHKNLQTS
jgi:hypothetical protein